MKAVEGTARAPWVLVAGGFHQDGGMDKANAALASYLAARGTEVEIVSHRVDDVFRSVRGVHVHIAALPAGSYLLGECALDALGRRVARRTLFERPNARVVVNGGNSPWPGINWVHSVHAAWGCNDYGAPVWFRAKNRATKMVARAREREAMRCARLVITNSNSTREHIIRHLGVDASRVHTVYLGVDSGFCPVANNERANARAALCVPAERPLVAFVGTLGYDNNKGFDTLLATWIRLCTNSDWDADLIVAGAGRALERWKRAASDAGVAARIRFLGFSRQVVDILAAADLLVSPVRYEAYGLNVQEAVCRGIPALVSRAAGVSERYTPALSEMLLQNPEDVKALEAHLLRWRPHIREWKDRFLPLARELAKHDWTEMARQFVEHVEQSGAYDCDAMPPMPRAEEQA